MIQRTGNHKHNNNEMVETSSDQLPQQSFDKQSMTRIPHRFYQQVTYDEQLQAFVFTDNNALVLIETSITLFFMSQQGET